MINENSKNTRKRKKFRANDKKAWTDRWMIHTKQNQIQPDKSHEKHIIKK